MVNKKNLKINIVIEKQFEKINNQKKIKLKLLDDPYETFQKNTILTESELPFNLSNRNNNEINIQNTLKKFEKENLTKEEIYKLITSNLLINKITILNIEKFILNKLPENTLLMTNINIYKNCFNILNKKNEINIYNYEMEILSNNNYLITGKIVKNSSILKIKLFITNNHKEYKYIGKIVSNILRSNFNVYIGKKGDYKKILNVEYRKNFLGLFGIRIMKVEIINELNTIEYKNKLPKFSKQYQKYFLDFNQRVRLSSKRNFILENNFGNKVIQCGKIDNNTYALDFENLSPIEAFSISITSLVNKIFCE